MYYIYLVVLFTYCSFVVQTIYKMGKTRVIQVRFSEENVVVITAKTELMGLSISAYVRMCVMKDLKGSASVTDRNGNTVSGRIVETDAVEKELVTIFTVAEKPEKRLESSMKDSFDKLRKKDWQKDADKRNTKTK